MQSKINSTKAKPSARRSLLAIALVASCLGLTAHAQTAWPSKPVKLVVAFPPGGVADVMSRVVSQPLSEALGQPVVIENKGGANGNVAADAVTKAPADGYTLLVSTTGIESVNPFVFTKMPYDPQKDLAPVAMLGRIQLFLVTKPGLPVKDAKEFVAHAKASATPLSYGSAGPGSTPHLAGELFKQQAGFPSTHIPYRGAAPALQDLLASQIDYYFDPGISFPHVRTGKLKMLAVASNKRSALFPDVPTLGEAGYKGVEADTWFGVYAPAGVPAEVVARLNREINKALAVAAVKARFTDVGGEATPMSPAEFKTVAQTETRVFSALIKDSGIKLD
jgi:tripartite-type tricarboxylate transporter receptor subunit TctC